jgi:hypothetical protein
MSAWAAGIMFGQCLSSWREYESREQRRAGRSSAANITLYI